MNRIGVWVLSLVVCTSARAVAQDAVVSMDDEPHYSRVFGNEYCRAYTIELGRLEQTKAVVHEHDWVRMTLGGTVEQAWGGTLFSGKGFEDPEGYYISFNYPVDRLTLRNPHNDPYRELIVEIMEADQSRSHANDPSLAPFALKLGPGVDPHVSYVTNLTKTSVEIVNVQLLGGDSKEIRSIGVGALFVALTDVELQRKLKDQEPKDLQLTKGDVKWLPADAAATFKNVGKEPARFVILDMK
jgi:hypothetical protein